MISGYGVHPAAASILRNRDTNCIDSILMDTTWPVLTQYVTLFLVIISRNMAIPLAFAFGRAENCEMYDSFWSVF
jgi:hypothetical protein